MKTATRTKEEQKQIAATILTQLGGRRFMAMTGSKNMLFDDKGLRMDLTRNKSGANKLQIDYNDDDTYTMKFMKFIFSKNTFECLDKGTFESVYADQLRSIFTDSTGLYTSL